MQVTTYNLDGKVTGSADLVRTADAQFLLDGMPVLAVSLWGAKVALTIPRRLVLIAMCDYGRLTRYGGLVDQTCAARRDGLAACAPDRPCHLCEASREAL